MVLQRAANLGSELFVGVSSDALNFSKKSLYYIFSNGKNVDNSIFKMCNRSVFRRIVEIKKSICLSVMIEKAILMNLKI